MKKILQIDDKELKIVFVWEATSISWIFWKYVKRDRASNSTVFLYFYFINFIKYVYKPTSTSTSNNNPLQQQQNKNSCAIEKLFMGKTEKWTHTKIWPIHTHTFTHVYNIHSHSPKSNHIWKRINICLQLPIHLKSDRPTHQCIVYGLNKKKNYLFHVVNCWNWRFKWLLNYCLCDYGYVYITYAVQ